MELKTKFCIGDTIYLKTDAEQLMRIITGILVRATHHSYEVTYSDRAPTYHYDYELCAEKDVMLALALPSQFET